MTRGDTAPVLVTGSTGGIGRLVVDELVDAGVQVRALTRKPELATFPSAVEVVRGDFNDPGSLEPALQDVSAVFLVWTLPFDPAPAVVERLASIERRVVFLSAPHRTPHPFFQQPNPMATLHANLEQLFADAGLVTTFVRPGVFASNALNWWAPTIKNGGAIRWPFGGAEAAPVDERDVAAVAARVLCDPSHAGGDYVLTGPEALSQGEQVRIIGTVIGRDVGFVELSPEEFRQETAGTWPRPVVDMLLSAWEATMGHPAFVTSTVSEILGSPPRTYRQWVTDHADSFR
jgi:uncharacterized protein YbjT (DUF2867 family)